MSKVRLVGFLALGLTTVCVTRSWATDVSTKRLVIKDPSDPAKRLVQVQSNDPGVRHSDADDPSANGAALHVYSASDDFCAILPAGAGWVSKPTKWKYKNKAAKTSAQVQDGKVVVTIRSGITYALADDGTQGVVNAQLQFGTGTRFCMRCSGNKKDTPKKFVAKDCSPAPCAAEPSSCNPPGVTTTSTTTAAPGTTTSTTTPPGGLVLKGALTATFGRFNYNATVGLPGANAACNTNFAGSHACTYAELQSAAAGDLDGLEDIASNTVTSFWAIDSGQPPLQQCNDDVSSGLNWEYATAHTQSRGQKVDLNNAAGTLGPLQSSLQCNSSTSWVGCCS